MTNLPEKIPPERVRVVPNDDRPTYVVGDWYWVTEAARPETRREYGREAYEWFAVVSVVGSNYVKFEGPTGTSARVHVDHVDERVRREHDPGAVTRRYQEKYRQQIRDAVEEMKQLTAGLGLPLALPQGAEAPSETNALATRQDTEGYQAALVAAEETSLPELQERVKAATKKLTTWMSVDLTGVLLQTRDLEEVGDAIKSRIASLSIYAGVSEHALQIRDGKPAEAGDKLHVLQSRRYMDEECIAAYQVGGITCESIEDFDSWLVKPENADRLLPHPRTVVAFRVRRNKAERTITSLVDIYVAMELEEADRWTFLYVRNGDQLWRISTELDFGHRIFPKLDELGGPEKVWAKVGRSWRRKHGDVEDVVSEGEYLGARRERRAGWKRYLKWAREHAKEYDRKGKHPSGRAWNYQAYYDNPHREHAEQHFSDKAHMRALPYRDHVPFDQSTVYYDDVSEHLRQKTHEYNRIAILLQGLYDRSEVLLPHPKVNLGRAEEFASTVVLVHDAEFTLTAGDAPNFEEYAARLRESIGTDSVTIGQEAAWLRRERAREVKRIEGDWRERDQSAASLYAKKHYRPQGDPGPGHLATMSAWQSKARRGIFRWTRRRLREVESWERKSDRIACTITVSDSALFNVSAYQPGDFRQFYDDPRTREQYLKWAGILLAAEEYHAGNFELGASAPRLRSRSRRKG